MSDVKKEKVKKGQAYEALSRFKGVDKGTGKLIEVVQGDTVSLSESFAQSNSNFFVKIKG